MILVSCVHIPVTKEWQKSIKQFDKIFITNDGSYTYKFETLDGYEDFLLYDFIHKSAASKNYALYRAYFEEEDVCIVDSDCIIPKDFQNKHLLALSQKTGEWDNPLQGTGFYSRGYPLCRDKEVVANVGLWTEVLDINGMDRAENEPKKPLITGSQISRSFIPFSGMNVAIKREAIPALFFLPNFGDFRRHDDIYGGYIFQSIAKKKGDYISYGEPFVKHISEVNAYEDKAAEGEMICYQEEFNQLVDDAISRVKVGTYKDTYKDFVSKVKFKGTRFEELLKPMKIWVSLFQAL